ncbi:MAG: hypothetical protein LBH05_06940 [Deferribacteraceae bacterium]|jgi:hypothetical protein|nr:hypothetical protein [Deferribacteraceae bacterium]
MKRLIILLFIIVLPVILYASDNQALTALFPALAELPGGSNHWVTSTAPPEEANGCTVYSATYAYFAKDAKPLYDIPRKNVYSVNIRFHSCQGVEAASKLYDKFSAVGEKNRKKLISLGNKGLLYVVPSPLTELMGDYYLTSLFKYIVLQIHADDGFVLMDIGEMMAKRLERYINAGKEGISAGVTLLISKPGYDNITELVSFTEKNVKKINLTGIIYNQNNRRVPEATVTTLETGDSTVSDGNGEFTLNLNAGKGNELNLFRALTIIKNEEKETPLNGYYMVDIAYPDNRVGQDIWLISAGPDGKISGISMNLRDENLLEFTGVLNGDNLTIDRPCGNSALGYCRQQFKARKNQGVYEGFWAGNMGKGEWKLYTSSFGKKTISVTMKEADFKITPEIKNNQYPISTGKDAKYITLSPVLKKHSNFLCISARILAEVSAKSGANKPIYLYGLSGGKNEFITASHPLPISDSPAQAAIDITNIYREAFYKSYILGFSDADKDIFSAALKPSVELTFAEPLSKAAVPGALTAKLLTFNGDDIAGNTKLIRPGGDGNIAVELNISAFGSALKGVEVVAKGKEGRRWNTYTGNFYPGIAVFSGELLNGELLNDKDGSVNYPLQKFNEKLTLYMGKGSLDPESIDSIEITLKVNEYYAVAQIKTEE